MELSPEDALRLNVLLARKPQAVRIDEQRMLLHALLSDGTAQITLNPNCRDDRYLTCVREALSGQVLGSPGGYPVYLQRWTRMGQMRDDNLEQLLVLGEPEAVVAVVHAPGLTDELARRAWWAMPEAENARRMLARRAVAEGAMGPELAAYLVEHLPFETEPEQMMDTVALVLQPGLVPLDVKLDLWKKAARKNAYYVGFLAACPSDLPADAGINGRRQTVVDALGEATRTDPLAALYVWTLSAAGQAFIDTAERVLKKPSNQEVVTRMLDILANNFADARPDGPVDQTLDELEADADGWLRSEAVPEPLAALVEADPVAAEQVRALRVLSGMSYGVVRPVLRDTTAIGSLMRRKLEPVLNPVLVLLKTLKSG